MANNYCESSSFIDIPDDKIDKAREILQKVREELEASEDGYAGFDAKIERGGAWIVHNESINPDHVESLVRALVEELDLPPVVVSWSYTCSKPRIDEFGGGAFVVKKGFNTVWIDARNEAEKVLARDLM
ncbi:MAG: hypothetical protein VKL39_23965 [Leptolyngbyaceae bacterium]|nr:hypothetical protein [Leptolyngbyaceae bacterium]